jgi:hypothetical protein
VQGCGEQGREGEVEVEEVDATVVMRRACFGDHRILVAGRQAGPCRNKDSGPRYHQISLQGQKEKSRGNVRCYSYKYLSTSRTAPPFAARPIHENASPLEKNKEGDRERENKKARRARGATTI